MPNILRAVQNRKEAIGVYNVKEPRTVYLVTIFSMHESDQSIKTSAT